jgi:hypothetical protein
VAAASSRSYPPACSSFWRNEIRAPLSSTSQKCARAGTTEEKLRGGRHAFLRRGDLFSETLRCRTLRISRGTPQFGSTLITYDKARASWKLLIEELRWEGNRYRRVGCGSDRKQTWHNALHLLRTSPRLDKSVNHPGRSTGTSLQQGVLHKSQNFSHAVGLRTPWPGKR